jgi:hypothetical protein
MAASSDSNIATYVRLASCKAEISACYHVMKQLRLNQPCMTDVEVFASSVQRLQQQEGYQLASLVLRDTCAVVAVAGYRVGESLANGKELYVYGELLLQRTCMLASYQLASHQLCQNATC